MSCKDRLEILLTKLGKNNKPTIVAMGIAVAKGIFRPLFTMMDKHEKPETKRYTATREGLTEVIALGVYYLNDVVTLKLAEKLANPKFFMDKKTLSAYKSGVKTPKDEKMIVLAQKLAKENLPKIKSNLCFIGVCVSALFTIPFVCSLTIKPIMNMMNKKQPPIEPQQNRYANLYNPVTQPNSKIFRPFVNTGLGGMKVGGL